MALVLGLACHACVDIPAGHEKSAAHGLEAFVRKPGTALREHERPPAVARAADFSACLQFFANAQPPLVAASPSNRALCYDAFAILHSGESKTAVFVAERLNKASVADADEKRSNRFYPDARLPAAERASLDDYSGSGFDRGHMAPAGDMPTAQAMAQSFSLANMVPQAPEHNRGAWAKSVEAATRKYAARATGDVYVITGPVASRKVKV